MLINSYELHFTTSTRTDIIDMTGRVEDCLGQSQVANGALTVFIPGSTAAVTTIEYESGVLNDLLGAVERLAPESMDYAHDSRWGDGNGYSHVRAALLGPSLSIPIIDGCLALGVWQQIVLLDFDNRPRKRKVLVQILGERAGE
ncbi:MAG: YjbQ family protein [Deltaproteobacteria bacterium]|nr:YjbQ family protein [Deltaproteobacteria bacterium]